MPSAPRITVTSTVSLEARWDRPDEPQAVIVFCHPHPRQGGTMTAPLMEKTTAELVSRGLAVLRFNFRGVGGSTGAWSDGVGEIDDVAAAVDAASAEHPSLSLGIAGWSFGAATSLHWQARARSDVPWAGIAPPVVRDGEQRLPDPPDLPAAPRTFIVGDRDQFVTVDEMRDYASAVGGELHVVRGSDHFFIHREERVAGLVTEALCRACLSDA